MTRYRKIILAAMTSIAGIWVTAALTVNQCGPAAWSVVEMSKPLAEWVKAGEIEEAGILRWQINEDDRPLYSESAIVAARDQSHWYLGEVFRHPRSSSKPGWQIAIVYDAPQTPARTYRKAPTQAEIEEFLEQAKWSEPYPKGFRQLDRGSCPSWW